jgi:glycosyltransferase involved in cell wall biosynthesis
VVHDLTEAMHRLAQDPGLRACMAEAGRKRVVETYLWDRKGEWLNAVYTALHNPCAR